MASETLVIIGSSNGLSSDKWQAILNQYWLTVIWNFRNNLQQSINKKIFIKIKKFSFRKTYLKMLSTKWQPFLSRLQFVNQWSAGNAWLHTFSQHCDYWWPGALAVLTKCQLYWTNCIQNSHGEHYKKIKFTLWKKKQFKCWYFLSIVKQPPAVMWKWLSWEFSFMFQKVSSTLNNWE